MTLQSFLLSRLPVRVAPLRLMLLRIFFLSDGGISLMSPDPLQTGHVNVTSPWLSQSGHGFIASSRRIYKLHLSAQQAGLDVLPVICNFRNLLQLKGLSEIFNKGTVIRHKLRLQELDK